MGFWIGILLGVALLVTSTLLYRESDNSSGALLTMRCTYWRMLGPHRGRMLAASASSKDAQLILPS